MNFTILKNKKGFTFVEMLVVFAIITTSMVAIFSLITRNIRVQKINKDSLVASMLAQEGLELVRAVRDENWMDQSASGVWDRIVDDTDDTFSIDFDGTINRNPNSASDSDCRLYLDAHKFYTHTSAGNTPTQFYRIIEVDDTNAPKSVEVSSKVEWTIRGKIHSYVATTVLYDWK